MYHVLSRKKVIDEKNGAGKNPPRFLNEKKNVKRNQY